MPDHMDAIRARANSATPGPWYAWNRGVGYEIALTFDEHGRPEQLLPEGLDTSVGRREDAEFIAHSRADVPWLLDENARIASKLTFHSDLAARASRGALRAQASYAALSTRIDAVRALHQPQEVYGECGHDHADTDPRVRNVDGVGLVCDVGYQYSICHECCTEGGYQTVLCADYHVHALVETPCPTIRALDGESAKGDA